MKNLVFKEPFIIKPMSNYRKAKINGEETAYEKDI
jgi:hypothetical protein